MKLDPKEVLRDVMTETDRDGRPIYTMADAEALCRAAERLGLDPYARQIYAAKRKGRLSIQATIDGFRVVAERTGQYRGATVTTWCGMDGEWRDVWLAPEPPAAARVGVYREGYRDPLYAVARYDAYVQRDYRGEINNIWQKMPDVMLAKCAEALALRRAFPNDLSGVYTTEEMGQADSGSHDAPQEAPQDAPRNPYTPRAAVAANDPDWQRRLEEDDQKKKEDVAWVEAVRADIAALEDAESLWKWVYLNAPMIDELHRSAKGRLHTVLKNEGARLGLDFDNRRGSLGKDLEQLKQTIADGCVDYRPHAGDGQDG